MTEQADAIAERIRRVTDLCDVVAEALQALRKTPSLQQASFIACHPAVGCITRQGVTVLLVSGAIWEKGAHLLEPFHPALAAGETLALLLGPPSTATLRDEGHVAAVLDARPKAQVLAIAVERTFDLLEARRHAESRGESLDRYRIEMGEMVGIARAMTTERDVDKLLSVILEKSRFVTDADAGSIYVIETTEGAAKLHFKLAQNDSVSFDSREFVMPLSSRSIAGSAALEKRTINIPDVYRLPAEAPFGFDRSFDERTGYRTKSVLAAPLISQRDEVIGVIQLINKKRYHAQKLTNPRDVDDAVIPFDVRSEELLGMVAAQAGACLESALLYDEIRRLFDGFVRASVEAIESRDPTTSGHSRRVADLTVGLAKFVDREASGPYKSAFFSAADLREIEYASLLHDFGKIGVRERVLVKAKKLEDERLMVIRARFDFAAKSLEANALRRSVAMIRSGAPADELATIERDLAARLLELEQSWQAILAANEPTVLAGGEFERIERIAAETFFDAQGRVQTLLTPEEAMALRITRGSLTTPEFDEIRSHVAHTFRFLSQIPWGKQFSRVPIIAGAHHERLNGTGYPNRWRAEEIPIQSKMMSIADVFDALTASDRPYKKAVPVERALDILNLSVKDGHLDGDLVRIFCEAHVWERRE